MDVGGGDQCFFARLQVAEFFRNFNIRLHAIPFECHLFPHQFGVFQDVADASDLGGEGSNNDASRGVTKQVLEVFMHLTFRRRQAFFERSQALEHEERRLREVGQVRVGNRPRINGFIRDSPVAHVNDRSGGRGQDDADRVHDGVLHLEEFHLKHAKVNDIR